MTKVLERLQRERADFLAREAKELSGEATDFLVFARENCNFVALLSLVWQMLAERLPRGGVPAKLFVEECEHLLTLLAAPERVLAHVLQVWDERSLPGRLAEPVRADVRSVQATVQSLLGEVTALRDRVLQTPRGVSADPEELKRRIERADANYLWQSWSCGLSTIRADC